MSESDEKMNISHPSNSTNATSPRPKKMLKPHNNAARERSRVRTLREAFLQLQQSLPAVPPNTKLSKLDVLLLATAYICHLTQILQKANSKLMPTHCHDDTGENLKSIELMPRSNTVEELQIRCFSSGDFTGNDRFSYDLPKPLRSFACHESYKCRYRSCKSVRERNTGEDVKKANTSSRMRPSNKKMQLIKHKKDPYSLGNTHGKPVSTSIEAGGTHGMGKLMSKNIETGNTHGKTLNTSIEDGNTHGRLVNTSIEVLPKLSGSWSPWCPSIHSAIDGAPETVEYSPCTMTGFLHPMKVCAE
ncbi:transcription factor 24 [Plakobranchus ocellatus]|uniref:Transcription factor 24 n=1 Tax=Plakobranchus ocellatus TaxID=259542 RepID=A0AAV3ZHQ5_9GAST|nr:transcription factor 24 [Plakobranchus ocellatus]